MTLHKILFISAVLAMSTSAFAASPIATPTTQASVAVQAPAANPATALKPAAVVKPARPALVKKAVPRAKTPKAPILPKPVKTIEAELSGITTQFTDSVFARLRLDRKKNRTHWFMRTSYSLASTDTIYGKKIITTKASVSQLDGELRHTFGNRYTFFAAGANIRGRSPSSVLYRGRSGYYITYVGKGRQFSPQFEAGFGIGLVHNYDDGSGTRPTCVLSLRGTMPLSGKLTLDNRVLAMQPSGKSIIMDGETAVQYPLLPGLFLRLGYASTNLIRPVLTSGAWNNTMRMTLVFRKTT